MVWLKIEDSWYYENETELINALHKNKVSKAVIEKVSNKNTTIVFTKEDVTTILKEKNYDKVIMSPFSPETFKLSTSFFGVVEITNKYGLLTSSEYEAGVTEYDKLNRKLGLVIEKSTFTFKDMSGSEKLIEVVTKLITKYAFGEIPKAVFLAGIMGTGKTFFAQCLAGETDRDLVSFNLAKIMNMDNPIEEFDNIINYLVKVNGRYLLWIDEIEKMFNGSEDSEHIKNKFLTFLNDLGLTIKMDAFVVITANDVTNILQKNPEMVRGGRVEPFAKVFMDFLTLESAERITEMYLSKRNSEKERKLRIAKAVVAYGGDKLPDFLWINNYFKDDEVSQKIKQRVGSLVDAKIEEEFMADEIINEVPLILGENQYEELLAKMTIGATSQKIVDYIDRVYKQYHPSSSLNDYPYVPAEIKETVSQIFYAHMMEYIDENNLEKVLDNIVLSNIAIGDAGQMGVAKMVGNKDKFSIIIN